MLSKEKLSKKAFLGLCLMVSGTLLMAIFAEFAACKASGMSADSDEAQALVAKLQAYITANYYTCTDEILVNQRLMKTSPHPIDNHPRM